MFRRAVGVAALMMLTLAGPASAADSTVTTNDNFFTPTMKSVSVGDRVRWSNPTTGSNDHTSTANSGSLVTWNFTLNEGTTAVTSQYKLFVRVGSYGYHCAVHPSSMKGTVLVRLKSTRIDANSWTIRMATTNAPTGFVHEVQRRKKGTTTWFTLATTTNATARFDAPSAGTWQLRGRYKQTGGSASGYSPLLTLTTS
jgi:plastocyanin